MSYPEDKERGQRLREARKAAKLNQMDVERMVDIKQNTLSNYESGRLHIKPHALARLAELYGVDPYYLETGEHNMSKYYQDKSRKTYNDVEMNNPTTYLVMGLVNEAGEVAGKFKKIFRDKGGVFSDADIQALKAELGDVLWYLTQICTNLGFTLDEVMQGNIDKLASRLERGKIAGDGDDR